MKIEDTYMLLSVAVKNHIVETQLQKYGLNRTEKSK